MKRFISFILIFMLAFPGIGVIAADTGAVQAALVSIKERVSIPGGLDKFESGSHEINGKVTYSFNWYNEDYSKSVDIACDGEGRITSYHYYDNAFYSPGSGKQLPGRTKAEALETANAFITKALPEAFLDKTDCLVYNEESGQVYMSDAYTRYSFSYVRKKDGVAVKGNNADVQIICIGADLYVSGMNASFDYDATFEAEKELLADYKESYKNAFPSEMIYEKEYDGDKEEICLIYRIKNNEIGYISAYTGEVITEDAKEDVYLEMDKNESFSDTAINGAAGGVLTEIELSGLNEIAGLMSAEEVEARLRGISVLGIGKEYVKKAASVTKYGEDVYKISFRFEKDGEKKENIRVVCDAKTGKVLSAGNYAEAYDEELSEAGVTAAYGEAEKAVSLLAGEELSEFEKTEESADKNGVSLYYVRKHGGVFYTGNGISASYDAKRKVLTSYSFNYDADAVFPSAEGALSADEAYEKMLGYAPLQKLYIFSGGQYKLAYTLDYDEYLRIDAVTGERKTYSKVKEEGDGNYGDIENHWCKDYVTPLGEVGIAFEGDMLYPDKAITQYDLLRLFAAGCYYRDYMRYDAQQLIEALDREGIIKKEEYKPEEAVSREAAFVYMIRFMGLEEIAKLENIYKISYADADKLKEASIGYAAILSGLGIISGDGSALRPTDNITRAEAITMLYRYLK